MQCASYNNKPFMGRFYEWEPFAEGKKRPSPVCRSSFCLLFNSVAFWPMLREELEVLTRLAVEEEVRPQGRGEPAGVLTKGGLAQVTPAASVRGLRLGQNEQSLGVVG